MARPRKKIDPTQVEKLAAIQCSYSEMAAVLDCNESTLTRRFAQAIKKGREMGRMSMKRKQYEVGMTGNVTMLIWLGKQHLGQSDKREEDITFRDENWTEPIDLSSATSIELVEALLTKENPNGLQIPRAREVVPLATPPEAAHRPAGTVAQNNSTRPDGSTDPGLSKRG